MTSRKAWVAVAAGALVAGCGTKGGWQGAEAEKAYDKALEQQRLTAVVNNDDYYEIHKDGRIYVIADAGDLKEFMGTGELPLRVTRIGGGPNGETVVFGIARAESKKKEGFGAVEMYDGRREGAAKGFYAEVVKDNRYHVFGTWADLVAFRKTGGAGALLLTGVKGPNGETVLVAPPADALLARFGTLHATK